jgi:hypothetical protein
MSEATCGDSGMEYCRACHWAAPAPHIVSLMRATMSSNTPLSSRDAFSPELFDYVVPLNREGAGSAGCWPHPRALRAKEMHFCARKHRQGSRNNRHSLRNGFTAYTWSPRSTGLVSLRRLAFVTQGLTPASGDRDRTTSPYALARSSSRQTRPCQNVHRIPPSTFVTIAKRPSGEGGTAAINHYFPKNGRGIFLRPRLDIGRN